MNINIFEGAVFFLVLFEIVDVLAAQHKFHLHERFRDVFCNSGVTMAGTMRSAILCGLHCATMTTCTAVFYNAATKTCGTVITVAVPEIGCVQQTGSNLYVRMSLEVFEPYDFTPTDNARLSTETAEQICNSYNYHTVNEDIDASKTNCGTSLCCKSKGCRSGTYKQYSGTWSKTETGTVCQRWDQNSPHSYSPFTVWVPLVSSATRTATHNYCRLPGLNGYLWCYTMNPSSRWENCDVPACP